MGERCRHEERRAGPRVPLQYGSSPTEICCACGMYRLTLHTPGPWKSKDHLAWDLEETDLG